MCLISNKYKFIFIKPHRVSGTETEIFLKKFADEPYMKPKPQVKPGELYGHSTAQEIKDYLIKKNRLKDWDNYLKITIIRNPYSMILSHFGWGLLRKQIHKNTEFNEWLNINRLNQIKKPLSEKLFINNELIIDAFIIKENKENTINDILNLLGIKDKYSPSKKIQGHISSFDSERYREVCNQNSIDLIKNDPFFLKFMKDFNYQYS